MTWGQVKQMMRRNSADSVKPLGMDVQGFQYSVVSCWAWGALGVNAWSAPCSPRLSQGGYEVLGYGLPPPWRTHYGHLLQERFRRLVNIGQISSIHTEYYWALFALFISEEFMRNWASKR